MNLFAKPFRRNPLTLRERLLIQDVICLGVDFLLVGCAQFALMLHLGGARLGVSGVTGIRHGVFALLRKPEFFLGSAFFFAAVSFAIIHSSPSLPASKVPT